MASMIPAYGCLGFFFQGRARFGGLTTQREMFALAIYFGAFLFLFFIEPRLRRTLFQARFTVLSKDMQGRFMPSCCLLERRRVGMDYSLSQTRFVFPILFENPEP
jgi:hypothetical protein